MRRLSLIFLLSALFAGAVAIPAQGQGAGTLRSRISSGQAEERSLSAAAAKLSQLEASAQRQVTLLEGRLADAQGELDRSEQQLAASQAKLDAARTRSARLHKRLAQVQVKLAQLLRERYMSDAPDLITVVLQSSGFQQLLETLDFARRVQRADTTILDVVRRARTDADAEQRTLTTLVATQQTAAAAVKARRDALQSITAGLVARRDELARAKQARLELLSKVRSRRQAAQKQLDHLLAEQAKAAVSMVGPGGPWAIPWAIVQCESGGQDLPPNYAGASGYYQFMVATWRGLGGSTPQAYQASKAEQDRLAARLWAGGAGAHNWVCAGIVGIH